MNNYVSSIFIRKLTVWSLYTLALLPFIPNGINSICMIVFVFFSLLYNFTKFREEKTGANNADRRWFLLTGGSFIIMAASLIYTTAPMEGLKYLQGALPMFIFPFCFFFLPFTPTITRRELDNIFTIFWISSIILAIWLYVQLGQADLLFKWDDSEHFATVFRETAIAITHKHPTYISIYFAFAICIAIYHFIQTTRVSYKIVYLLSILLLSFPLLQLAARMPIIAAFTGMGIILLWKIKSLQLKLALLTGIVVLLAVLIRVVPSIYSRVSEIKNTLFVAPVAEHYNSTNIRIGIYQCTWEGIKAHWLAGTGVAGEKKVLSDCYAQIPTDAYKREFYNTHNQYAHFWLMNGILAMLLFIASIIYAARIAVRGKDAVMLFFIILMAVSFLTENILSRQAGIVFYYFFLCILVHYHKVNRTSTTRAKLKGQP